MMTNEYSKCLAATKPLDQRAMSISASLQELHEDYNSFERC